MPRSTPFPNIDLVHSRILEKTNESESKSMTKVAITPHNNDTLSLTVGMNSSISPKSPQNTSTIDQI